ncbi:hypothetical protein QWI18_07240 [Pseudomonas sp. W2Oct36]|uniref:dermonecrotic toxin domain-containing protein n=1 Tax=Pseudomonas sp. W2Oct36 TaxID=1215284 RepID=UPI0034E0DE43
MTHRSVENSARQNAGSLLDHAKSEGELSASIVEQLRQAPTLQEAARQMLVDALARSTRFPNPDALFIHRKNTAGFDPQPLALTQALLHAFIGDRAYLDDKQAVVSTRRDSAHPAHALPGWDIEAIRTLFPSLLSKLPGFFKFSLDEYWTFEEQTFTPIPGEDAVTGTRDVVLEKLQSWVFHHAIQLAVGERELDGADRTRLRQVVDDVDCKGRYALSLRTSEGAALPLIGAFVATAENTDSSSLAADGNSSPVFLMTPAGGVEKFATLGAMEASLYHRLGEEDSRELLAGYLSLEHQLLIAEAAPGSVQLSYSPLNDTPAARFIASLQEKQINDFDHLSAQASLSSGDSQALLRMFDDVSRLDDLEQALNVRYLALLAFVQERSLPDWLMSAPAVDRQRYDALAQEQARCEERVQAQLVGTETAEIHARREIAAYLMKHLGYTFDPSSLRINLPDEMSFADAPLRSVYTNTLLGFALEGMPEVELRLGPSIEIDPAYSHLRLNFDFVCRLVRDLDLKRRYGLELERRYREQDTLKALSALRASDIALSACAATLQGQLSERGQALIERVQANLGRDSTLKIGALYLKGGNRRLEDVVVLREIRGKDEFYVLYAPGHPSGRDLFDFSTWRELSFEIRSWLATPQGAQYLLDQTVVNPDHHVVPYIARVQLVPSEWTADSVQFISINGSFLTDALSGLSYYKIEQILARDPSVSSARMQHVTDQQRTAQVLLDHRIEALNAAYDKFGITPWREAARRECERLITAHLRASGIPGSIDPDTVFCDLENATAEGQPDFGRYTTLKCLTDLFMVGYSEEEYAFHPAATLYSSIGQDLSALSGAIVDSMIRGSNYADEYLTQLRRHTWSISNSPPETIVALFSRKTHYQMRRDALDEYVAGRLALDQYNWLVRMIAGLDGSIVGNTVETPGTFHRLVMEHKTLVDIYLFKPDATHARFGTLAYTPDAPDGHLFRQEDDIVRSVSRPGMNRYYYDRANFRAQGTIGPLLQKLEQSPMVGNTFYKVARSVPSVRNFEDLHDFIVTHLMVDIDAQTESVNERRLLKTYNFVRKYGGYVANLNPKTKAVWTALHATVDLFRGIYAYQDGNHERAKRYFIDAAKGAYKTAKQVRKIRKAEKLKRLGKTSKPSSVGLPQFQ